MKKPVTHRLDLESAKAVAIQLAVTGRPFSFTPDGDHALVAVNDGGDIHVPYPHYTLIQEGGSSTELYVHAHATIEEAEGDREDCASNGGYRTSEVVVLPPILAAVSGPVYEYVEAMLDAASELDFPDVEDEFTPG